MLLVLLYTLASAATLTVGSPYATIQDAVDASSPGDTVVVPAGDWFGDVLVTHSLILNAPEGPEVTALVGRLKLRANVEVSGFKLSPSRNVVAVVTEPDSRVRLDNVEITRSVGRAPLVEQRGRRLTIDNSRIHSATLSTLSGTSAGLVLRTGVFVMRNSVVEDIEASWVLYKDAWRVRMLLEGNIIRNNVSEYEPLRLYGGYRRGHVELRDNEFYGNYGGNAAVLAAELGWPHRVIMTGNRFADNVGSVGVIAVEHRSYGANWRFRMHGNTFVANRADAVLWVDYDVLMQVANNMFAYNEGVAFDTVEVTEFFDHNLWWDNDVDVLGVSLGENAVLMDPLFVAFTDNGDPTDDDLDVQAESPALGAGRGPGGSTRDIGAL